MADEGDACYCGTWALETGVVLSSVMADEGNAGFWRYSGLEDRCCSEFSNG